MEESAGQPHDDASSQGQLDITALYELHRHELLRFLVGVLKDRWLAEDVVQGVFAKAVIAFREANAKATKNWLFKVALHEAIDVRRRRHAERKVLQKLARSFATTADLGIDADAVARIHAAMQELPSEQCEVVKLRLFDDLSFAEIAKRLGIPLGTALTRMRLALEKLRGRLPTE